MLLSNPAQERITKLQQVYIASMHNKHSEVTTGWMLAEQKNWQTEGIENLAYVIHRLAHTAASFGFPNISATAREIEALLTTHMLTENILEVRRKLQALCGLLTIYASQTNHPELKTVVSSGWIHSPHKKRLLLVDQHAQFNKFIRPLETAGYTIISVDDLTKLPRDSQNFDAIILNSAFNPAHLHEFSEFAHSLKINYPHLPILYIFSRNDFSHRLQAVRLGAKHYLTQPIVMSQLLSCVENLLNIERGEPYRVLLLEEDAELAALYQTSLEQAGLITHMVSDSQAFMDALVEFKPEVILLDSNAPHCNGTELANILRQEEAYTNVSILFLSTDSHETLSPQLLGSVQFLNKPIPLDYLTELVLHKARNSRKLQVALSHDKVTDLLNEYSFKERLQAHTALAERGGSPITVAMLNVVQFKKVNQQYGYWVGNQLLKNIAKTLRQRLRRGDLVGRSSENYFLIALYDADQISAQRVLQKLLQAVSQQIHIVGEKQTLHLQWNIGAAHYPGHAHPINERSPDILALAQTALKAAKKLGYNQVVLQSVAESEINI